MCAYIYTHILKHLSNIEFRNIEKNKKNKSMSYFKPISQ